jgi:hypothetical protein
MEDASAVDLDWFWRGWFYDIEPVDIAIDSVKVFTLNNSKMPLTVNNKPVETKTAEFESISKIRNRESGIKFMVDRDTLLKDFYFYYKPEKEVAKDAKPVIPNEVVSDSMMESYKNNYYYEVSFTNKGGLVMPIIVQWNYTDGSSDIDRISAQIWRKNEQNVIKTFGKKKEVASIVLDPFKETADINEANNTWNVDEKPTRFQLFKSRQDGGRRRGGGSRPDGNPMQKANAEKNKGS